MPALSSALLASMQRIGALLQASDWRSAHDQLEAVLAQHPDYVEAMRLLAGTRQTLGDVDGAEALLRKACAVDPNWAPTLLTLGELLLERGRNNEAEPLLQRAAQRLPQAALLLARHYNDSQRPTDALALLEPLCSNGPADAELVTQHIAALTALGRQREAVTFYQRAADAAPDHPAATHALAAALDAAGRSAEAVTMSQRSLVREPRNPTAHFTLARSLITLGRFDRAEIALRDGLRLQPRQADAHNHLARLVWMRTGDREQATAVLDQALQTFANDDSLHAAKAAILQGAGDARGAYACLATQAARAQASPSLLVRAGLAALEFDPALSLTLAERALTQSSDSTAARNLLMASQLGIGDARSALSHCETLLRNAPDDQYLVAMQTTAWRMLGDERYAARCDYAQLVLPQILPIPHGWSDLPSFLADLKRSLDRLHDPSRHPLLFQSLRHGTETTEDLTRSADPVIQALFQSFAPPIGNYLAHIGHGDDPLRRRNPTNNTRDSWRFNGSWSVRLRRSGFHTNHVHPRGWISSAFYVDLPDSMASATSDDGCLAFGEPGIITTPHLPTEFVVRPQPGMLVLFPSYAWHGTLPFSSDQTRLTVAFDVLPNVGDRR